MKIDVHIKPPATNVAVSATFVAAAIVIKNSIITITPYINVN
jgi:hypothetical protein